MVTITIQYSNTISNVLKINVFKGKLNAVNSNRMFELIANC